MNKEKNKNERISRKLIEKIKIASAAAAAAAAAVIEWHCYNKRSLVIKSASSAAALLSLGPWQAILRALTMR